MALSPWEGLWGLGVMLIPTNFGPSQLIVSDGTSDLRVDKLLLSSRSNCGIT
jgi:hypothetical protein